MYVCVHVNCITLMLWYSAFVIIRYQIGQLNINVDYILNNNIRHGSQQFWKKRRVICRKIIDTTPVYGKLSFKVNYHCCFVHIRLMMRSSYFEPNICLALQVFSGFISVLITRPGSSQNFMGATKTMNLTRFCTNN